MKTLRGIAGLTVLAAASWTAPAAASAVTEWNALAIGCITRPGPGGLLDLALAQAAVHDAIQAIEKSYQPYLAAPAATGNESKSAAAAAAAYRVLSDDRICPENATATVQSTLNTAFAPYLAGNDPGLVVGYAAGDALLAQYRGFTTPIPQPFNGAPGPGQWRPTPPALAPMAFVYIATATPFTMTSPSQFRPGPPPALTSAKYLREYNEVKKVGSVASHPAAGACPAPRNTDMARFWSGNFVAQWNQAARDMALDRQLSLGQTARLLALANLASADSAIAIWDSKYHYNYWRPIAAIREAATDGNNSTVADPNWTPFIQGPHFPTTPQQSQTPPYPDYVSGANGLTGAYVATLQLFFGTDWVPFEIYKATPASVAICKNPRTYRRLSEAADEVVDARIFLGIHFRTADVEARRLGTRVAWWTFTRTLRPLKHHDHD
jgi:hypothetical protein